MFSPVSLPNPQELLFSRFSEFRPGAKKAVYGFSPGRVNIIGEHIDYCGGTVFPAAIGLGTHALAVENGTDRFRVESLNLQRSGEFSVTAPPFGGEDAWLNYPLGTFKMLAQRFGEESMVGMDILLCGNLPIGSSLSSSASLIVCLISLMEETRGLVFAKDSVENLRQKAYVAQSVETDFVGMNCGIMDQASVIFGKKGHLMLMDCANLNVEYVPFQAGKYNWVIADTRKPRRLVDSKYNERKSESDRALEILKAKYPIENLCEIDFAETEKALGLIKDEVVKKRARHILRENERVHQSAKLLLKGDYTGFGELLTQSHFSLKDDYEVTGPELDSIVLNALKLPGVLGARMTGAGFSGCAVYLCESDRIEEICERVSKIYQAETNLQANFYPVEISRGVSTRLAEF